MEAAEAVVDARRDFSVRPWDTGGEAALDARDVQAAVEVDPGDADAGAMAWGGEGGVER